MASQGTRIQTLHDNSLTSSTHSSSVCSAPPNWYSMGWDDEKSTTGWFFACGDHSKAISLARIVISSDGSCDKLELRPASLTGHRIVHQDSSDLVVEADDNSTVRGVAFLIESEGEYQRLQACLGSSYRIKPCRICLEDGPNGGLVHGQAFVPNEAPVTFESLSINPK